MNDTDKKKILEFCGFTVEYKYHPSGNYTEIVYPDSRKKPGLPDLTCDWLFVHFVPAWNKAKPTDKIIEIAFVSSNCTICHGFLRPEEIQVGKTQAEAFANAALKLIEQSEEYIKLC